MKRDLQNCAQGPAFLPEPCSMYESGEPDLGLGEAELGGELHPLGRGQVLLHLKALLQTIQLLVAEHGAGLAAAAVLAGRVMLEQPAQM